MVKRLFVEKKKGFDVEARGLFNDIVTNLHPEGLTGIRVLNRYDMQGLDDATYETAKREVFAEPAIDAVYDEELPEGIDQTKMFAIEYLPGQSDQRAD